MPLSLGLPLASVGPLGIPGPATLYQYLAGNALPGGSTFTRADAQSCATQQDVNGVYQTVAANVLRDGHYIGGVRTALLEPSRQAAALGACTFGVSTYWSTNGGFSITTATSCLNGQTAYQHQNNGSGLCFRYQAIGTFVSGQTDVAWAILENVNAATAAIRIYDATALATAGQATLTFSNLSVALSGLAGVTGGVIALGNSRYLLWCAIAGTASGTAAAGHTRRVDIFPSGTATNTNTAILHAASLEPNASYPTSPLVTVASAVTRAADALTLAGITAPATATLYTRYYDLSTHAWVDGVAAYTSGQAITPAVARAYSCIAVLEGSLTGAQCRAITSAP